MTTFQDNRLRRQSSIVFFLKQGLKGLFSNHKPAEKLGNGQKRFCHLYSFSPSPYRRKSLAGIKGIPKKMVFSFVSTSGKGWPQNQSTNKRYLKDPPHHSQGHKFLIYPPRTVPRWDIPPTPFLKLSNAPRKRAGLY